MLENSTGTFGLFAKFLGRIGPSNALILSLLLAFILNGMQICNAVVYVI